MDRSLDSDEDRVAAEAAEWLMLLQEEPENGSLRRRFEAWLATSPAHEAAWADLRHVSDVAATMQPVYARRWIPFVARRRLAHAQPTTPGHDRPWLRRRVAITALAAVAACAAIVAGPGLILQVEADHVTRTAEQRRIELPDGSQVALAPASAIAISYAVGERRVRLLTGEAFFQVQPDSRRPFRVVARTVEATVLGTRFDVRLEPDDVTVSVEEGSVGVVASGSPYQSDERLGAGQSIRMSAAGTFLRTNEAPELVGTWRQGQLYLQEQRLGDAVAQLRRYFHGTIVIVGDTLADQRVTGAYNLADPEHALRGMARAHDATVRRITPWLLVLSES
jgi:transmembrane sensor